MKRYKFIGNPCKYSDPDIDGFEIKRGDEFNVNEKPDGWYNDIEWQVINHPNDWEEVVNSKDNINPDHYKQGKVECIDAIESATVNKKGIEAVCTANIIKYIWRYESKNGLEDVKKCRWYLEKLINHLNDK